jgi:hypothetical protein
LSSQATGSCSTPTQVTGLAPRLLTTAA